jgi:adenylate cyclase
MDDLDCSAYLEIQMKAELRKYPLAADKPCRIGRSEGNTIVLDDDLASRNHAIVQATDAGVFYVTDVGSTNGTLLNGGRVSAPTPLKPGDIIQIGSHAFTFYQQVPATPEPELLEQKATSLFVAMKVISVLVVDIRDFTGLGQRIGSEKLGEVAGTLFREGGQALQQHGAWAQKYIGDAVMAIWLHRGMMPEVDEVLKVFHALNTLRMIAGGLQQRFQLEGPIKIGAGMNTGPASIGNFGSIAASDHTALGDVVNKAFRLESATKELGCDLVLGPETHAVLMKAPGTTGWFTPGLIKLKGYNEPAAVYGGQLSSLELLLGIIQGDGTLRPTS